ncbi:g2/mitotic-specific cyclin-1 [Phtheirospermum japonicum]|uniref:G2/mitotic-specific cyclin-1 n=1 Tax=Phtheirospermum japonicum TaxID=374723 RepID=A0A830D922_9LAMI|nr:g2/mitotic-specific cyclin-1 [Phtheirospermum japonicum]
MEKQILGQMEWSLTVPTPYVFLVRFIKASLTDSNVENMFFFLDELGMMNYPTFMYCPSMIAASAVYAARCTLNKVPFWNETLKLHTGFSESQLMDCAKLLVSFHSMAAEQKLKGIYRKYSSSERGAVALLPPAKSLLDDIKDYLTSEGVEWEESVDLMEVASKCDVVYQTRIQRERFGERIDLYEEARGKYIVNRDVLGVMQKHAVVMHPLPRLDEITVDVDDDPRAAYFRQAKNGLYIRMALLKLLLLGW